jgi:hypothetical protein
MRGAPKTLFEVGRPPRLAARTLGDFSLFRSIRRGWAGGAGAPNEVTPLL